MQKTDEINLNREAESKPHSKNIIKLFILIIILVFSITLLVFSRGENLNLRSIITEIKSRVLKTSLTSIGTINFESGASNFCIPYGSGLIFAKNDGLKMYNVRGEEEWKEQKIIGNPLIKVNGRHMILVDITGKNVWVYRGKRELWHKTLDGEILTASINEKGCAGIIYRQKGYKNTVKIFDYAGTEVSTRYFSNNYALDVKISPDNKIAAIGEVNTSGLKVSSGVRLIPLGSENDTGVFEDDSVLEGMEFIGKNLIAVFDNKILKIGMDGTKNILKEFDKNKVVNIVVSKDKFIVKSEKNQEFLNSSNRIEIIDIQGKTTGFFDTKRNAEDIDIKGNTIAVSTGDTIFFVSPSGKQISRFDPKKKVKKIRLFSDQAHAAVIYSDSADIVNIY